MVRQRKIVDATALCPGTAGICIFDRSKAPPISVDLRWSPLFISKSSFEHPHFFHFIQNLQNLSQDFPGLPIFSPIPGALFFCLATAFAAQRPRSWCGNWAAPWWRSCWWRRCSWWWRWRTQISGGFSDGKKWGFHLMVYICWGLVWTSFFWHHNYFWHWKI